MAPRIPVTRATLDYLPYVCDFDPEDGTKLLVGGGGGANRSGVANRITVLESAENDPDLRITGEIDLSRDEDSVNTLVVGQKKGSSTLVYAGINSSPDDVAKGKNEHFRVFTVSPAPSKGTRSEKDDTKGHALRLTEASRTAIFDHEKGDKDAYQRLMRISPPFPSTKKQFGAIATGFATQAQIAIFEVGTATAPKPRGILEISREAVDLDVIQTGDDSFQIAYCDENELFAIDIKDGTITGPDSVFKLADEATNRTPTFKSIRYLARGYIAALSNLPNNGGSILSAIRLPDDQESEGRLAASAKLPKHFKKATCLAAQNVNPPTAPGAPLGKTSFVIAASSLDALSIWTLNHELLGSITLLVDFLTLSDMKEVHPLNITSLAFSGIVPAKTGSKASLKLASVSMNNTVAVHSIPLKQTSKASKPGDKDHPVPARYAVALWSRRPGLAGVLFKLLGVLLFIIIAVRVVILSDMVIESKSAWASMQDYLQITMVGPTEEQIAEQARRAAVADAPEVLTGSEFISNLLNFPGLDDLYYLHEGDSAEEAKPKIQAAIHNADAHGPAKSWEQLSSEQKALWKKKLADAGHWTEKMGDSVFKGVAFADL